MTIKTTLDLSINSTKYVSQTSCNNSYFFISATCGIAFEIHGEQYELTLQNGEWFFNNDTSCPTNEYSFYNSNYPLFETVSDVDIDDIDQDFADYIAEQYDKTYTVAELANAARLYTGLVKAAQDQLGVIEMKLDERVDNDNNIYIVIHDRYSESYSKLMTSEDAAEEYIKNNSHDECTVEIVDANRAYAFCTEQSNFSIDAD
jgi:hypothetical protein